MALFGFPSHGFSIEHARVGRGMELAFPTWVGFSFSPAPVSAPRQALVLGSALSGSGRKGVGYASPWCVYRFRFRVFRSRVAIDGFRYETGVFRFERSEPASGSSPFSFGRKGVGYASPWCVYRFRFRVFRFRVAIDGFRYETGVFRFERSEPASGSSPSSFGRKGVGYASLRLAFHFRFRVCRSRVVNRGCRHGAGFFRFEWSSLLPASAYGSGRKNVGYASPRFAFLFLVWAYRPEVVDGCFRCDAGFAVLCGRGLLLALSLSVPAGWVSAMQACCLPIVASSGFTGSGLRMGLPAMLYVWLPPFRVVSFLPFRRLTLPLPSPRLMSLPC